MKRVAPKPGDIVRIGLPSGRICFGRVYKDSAIGVYFQSTCPDDANLVASDPDLITGVFTRDFKSAGWDVCGHLEFKGEDESWPPPVFIRDILSSKFRIYYRGKMRPASCLEIEGLHEQLIYKPQQLAVEIDNRWVG